MSEDDKGKSRKISIVSLNYTVEIKSEYETDTLNDMKQLAFDILSELKKKGY